MTKGTRVVLAIVVYIVLIVVTAKWAPILTFFLMAGGFGTLVFVGLRQDKLDQAKNEALFTSMFPDLQPYYHPAKLFEYATARLKAAMPRSGKIWTNPPGFADLVADIRIEAEREVVRLLDGPGKLLTQFIFETHPEGAAIRFGKGKFTVSTNNPKLPRVRYWHPDREFKWTPDYWRFKTKVADRPFESSDRSTTLSDSSSFSSRAASAAPFVAAGGSFDGGGASQSWSEGGRTGATGAASTSY